jgi:uncharacterized protein YjiS (DUF1127 family)
MGVATKGGAQSRFGSPHDNGTPFFLRRMLVGLGRRLRSPGGDAETLGVNNQEIKVVYGARRRRIPYLRGDMLNLISLPPLHRTAPFDTTGLDTGEPPVLRAVMRRIGRTLGAWFDRADQRRALLELTDQHLADIGIDRLTARREAAKHFWQA